MFGRRKPAVAREPIKFHVSWTRGGVTFYVDATTGVLSCWTYDRGTRSDPETETVVERAMAELESALGREPDDPFGAAPRSAAALEWSPALPRVARAD